MGEDETIGLGAEFDAEAFNKGLNAYIKGLQVANTATEQAVAKFNALGASTQALAAGGAVLQTVSKNIGAVARAMTALNTIQANQGVIAFLNQLATAGGRISTIAPGLEVAGRSLASFARSLNSLASVQLNAQPITRFTDELFTALSRFGRFKTVTTTVGNLRSVIKSLQQVSTLQLNAGNISQFVTQFAPAMLQLSRALRNMAGISQIPRPVIATLASLGNLFRNFGAAPPNVGPFISAITRLANLLPKLSAIQAVPTKALDSIRLLGNSLSGLGNLNNLNPVISALRRLIPIFQQLSSLRPIPSNVMTSISGLGQAVSKLGNTQNLNQLSTVLKALTTATNQLSSAQSSAIPNLQRYGSAFTQGIGVGVGFGVVSVLRDVGRAIADLGREALNSIRFFETFTVAMETSVARLIQSKDASLSLADALSQAARPARALQLELERVAVFSPFTTEQIAIAFRTVSAYGFMADEALNLSKILVDFTSGTGLLGTELERIALAMAQVRARGKLAGQEVIQFANAGIPIYEILGKALGKTTGELTKMQEAGQLTSSTVLPIIIDHMKQWEGSGKRLATTFTGLLSSLTDIKQIAFRDFFGGAFKPIQPVLQELVEFLTSTEFKAALVVAGQLLGEQIAAGIQILRESIGGLIESFQSLSPETRQTIVTFGLLAAGFLAVITVIGVISAAVIALVNPFTLMVATVAGFATLWVQNFTRIQTITATVVNGVDRILGGLASNMVKWGQNIVTSLASGMAQAVGAVTRVLTAIARAIGRLLRPGSPPKILPHLDDWGRGAAEAYLEGWKLADFSALTAFSNIVQQNLQALATLGQVNELDVPGLVLQFRTLFTAAIDEVIKFGQATQATIQSISAAAGLAVDVIGGYLSRFAAVRVATEAVTQAQNELNATIKAYDDQLEPLTDRLSEINRLQTAAENTKKIARIRRALANQGITDSKRTQLELELEEILLQEQITALEAQKETAVEVGQEKLTAAQASLQSAQQELELFNAQIESQQQQVNLMAEQQRLLQALVDSLSDVGEKLKEGLTALEKQMKALEFQQQALQDNIDAEEARWILADKNSTAAEKYAAQLKLQEIALRRQITLAEAEKLGIQVDFTEIDKIPIVIADFRKNLKTDEEEFGSDALLPGLSGGLDELEKSLDEFDAAVTATREKVSGFFTTFQESLDKINASLPSFLQWKTTGEEAATGIDTFKLAFVTLGAVLAGGRALAILRGLPLLLGRILTKGNLLGIAIGLLATAWNNNWLDIQGKTSEAVTAIDKKIGELVGLTNWETFKTTVKDAGQLLADLATGKIIPANAGDLIAQKVAAINAALKKIGEGLFTQDTDTTIDGISIKPPDQESDDFGLLTLFTTAFQNLIAGIKKFWEDHIEDPGLVSWIGNVIGKFITLIGEKIGDVVRFMIGTALPRVIGAFGWLFSVGIPRLKTTLDNWGTALDTLFFNTMGSAVEGTKRGFAEFNTFLTVTLLESLKTAGKSIAEGFIDGFNDFIKTFGSPRLNSQFSALMLRIKKFWGIESPSTVSRDQFGVPIGEGLITGFIQAITDQTESAITSLQGLIDSIMVVLTTYQTDLTGEGGFYADLNEEIFSFYEDMATGSLEIIETMVDDVMAFFTGEDGLLAKLVDDFVEEGFDIGQDFGNGIADGIRDAIAEIEDASEAAVKAATKAARDEMEAESPSKRTNKELGRPFSQGFAQGILREVDSVIKATQHLANAAFGSMQQRLRSSSSNVSPVTNNSTRIYQLSVNSQQQSRGLQRDFRVMEIMGA